MIIFEVMTDIHSPIPLIDSGRVKRKKIYFWRRRKKGKYLEKEKIFWGEVMVNESVYLVVLSHYRAIVVGTLHCAFH